jgi:HAD superfamily hydrolase (TIGR01549 family)
LKLTPEQTKKQDDESNAKKGPAFLFDLDGTLVDSVYQHVLAWREAFREWNLEIAQWNIHRRIGMSGSLLVKASLKEIGRDVSDEDVKKLKALHDRAFAKQVNEVCPLPGARELLAHLTKVNIPWAIATTGDFKSAEPMLNKLELHSSAIIISGDDVDRTKPSPDIFLEAANRLQVPIANSVAVGDSIWDLLAIRRAKGIGIGYLSGGTGQDELERAGAYRVYRDPAEMLSRLHEVGIE